MSKSKECLCKKCFREELHKYLQTPQGKRVIERLVQEPKIRCSTCGVPLRVEDLP